MASYLEKRINTRHTNNGTITLYPTIMSIRNANADSLDFSEEVIRFYTVIGLVWPVNCTGIGEMTLKDLESFFPTTFRIIAT